MSEKRVPILGYEGRVDPEQRRRRRTALLAKTQAKLVGFGVVCFIVFCTAVGSGIYEEAGNDLGRKVIGGALLAVGLGTGVYCMASGMSDRGDESPP